eukprot:5440709-Pyramimonas_sp.AAC.1
MPAEALEAGPARVPGRVRARAPSDRAVPPSRGRINSRRHRVIKFQPTHSLLQVRSSVVRGA